MPATSERVQVVEHLTKFGRCHWELRVDGTLVFTSGSPRIKDLFDRVAQAVNGDPQ